MIDALIDGERDTTVLAEMAKGRLRAKIPQLQDALAGRFNEHHALIASSMLARIDQIDATIETLGGRIDELLDPYEAAATLLVTIPGVSRRTAQVILAEVGAAARLVHQGCRQTLEEYLAIRPVRDEAEGARLTLAAGFDASAVRLTGNVVGEAPFTGTLIHRGWRATQVRLPQVAAGHDLKILTAAEVEL